MVALRELVAELDALLQVGDFADYCPNGLQVEGRGRVHRILSGVTACEALVETAVTRGADLLLVHHGYFWRGEDPRVCGMKRRRLQRLLAADISLVAYHLPLDAHPELGNNAQLAQRLGLAAEGCFGTGSGPELGWYGRLPRAMTVKELTDWIRARLQRTPLHLEGGPEPIQRLGWCTGAAQSYLEAAADLGLDAFVTGEASEQTTHVARERGIHCFVAGHHATERYGVQALGAWAAHRFGLEHEFIEVPNPI